MLFANLLLKLLAGLPPDAGPGDMAQAREALIRSNLSRIRILMRVFITITALLLTLSFLLWDRAVQDFDSPAPMWRVTWLRLAWIVLNLAGMRILRRAEAARDSALRLEQAMTGLMLANMLMVTALISQLYPYFQSISAFLLGLFIHASAIRLDLRRSLLALGLPSLLLLGFIAGSDPQGARTSSNLVNLFFMTVLALTVMHALYAAGLRNMLQQLTIQRQNATLERLAMTDGLTGLANRRALDQGLEREWKRATREDLSLSVIILDIDHFKAFNDVLGHLAGDDCLRAVAGCLQQRLHRAGDLAARYGGEEFAVLLPGADRAGALAVAEDIRRDILGLEQANPGCSGGRLTVSLGIATRRTGQAGDLKSLVAAADRALYQAKSGGRNQTATAPEDAWAEPAQTAVS